MNILVYTVIERYSIHPVNAESRYARITLDVITRTNVIMQHVNVFIYHGSGHYLDV